MDGIRIYQSVYASSLRTYFVSELERIWSEFSRIASEVEELTSMDGIRTSQIEDASSRVSAILCPGSLKAVLFALHRCKTIAGGPCYRVHITHQKSEFSITTLCVLCYAIM
ncbi:uncharacterized protein LOC135820822 [Sycon ciliatum]|uniref:uncharacterized protein LOC135820822 n=1 Tax=Sycon ciliatum TaxID=27933 RepID=UPI0031F60A17